MSRVFVIRNEMIRMRRVMNDLVDEAGNLDIDESIGLRGGQDDDDDVDDRL
jgi:hypothetical protein